MADVKKAAKAKSPLACLLVANRGEIARRIMRSARDLGLRTVAVYADGDFDAPFVKEADAAVALGGRSASETYLDGGKIIAACKRSGADALHPGYGFLSENPAFAQAVIDAGLAWVGPPPKVIAALGDKLAAKRLMQEAGVPTLAATELKKGTDLKAAAKAIGYPVLVKAAAGGGGRGMRVVGKAGELAEAVESARREAGAAFADDRVFLEKWLASSRHVEIQILGDTHGKLVHCFERECSIQRRHQKIIEEAPSPAVTPAIREAMGAAALRAAKQLGYTSAGTVEFLLDGEDFWFLEVNARLQVEHPVTEAIIGRDLVREQLRIAEGEPLSFTQADLAINGHAIEARLCAEDPERDFLPSPGRLSVWQPASEGRARFDSGVETGSVISADFDPLMAKVIVHAPNRREAARRLARALEATRVQGLATNRDFLVATLRHPAFLAGDTSTDFIERLAPAKTRVWSSEEALHAAIACALESQARNRQAARVMKGAPSGWRNSVMPYQAIGFRAAFDGAGEGELHLDYLACRDGSFRFRQKGDQAGAREMAVIAYDCGQGQVDMAIDGMRMRFRLARDADKWLVQGQAGDLALAELPRFPPPEAAGAAGSLTAPMPGRVLAVEVKAGDKVAKGQTLMALEAMKMEHRIRAPAAGRVKAVHASVGDQVENGQALISLEA